jgi:hypothetical protein
MPTFPEWWRWELTFSGHAELRMEQRPQHPWIVIVEPDGDVKFLVVVTVYEVSE